MNLIGKLPSYELPTKVDLHVYEITWGSVEILADSLQLLQLPVDLRELDTPKSPALPRPSFFHSSRTHFPDSRVSQKFSARLP